MNLKTRGSSCGNYPDISLEGMSKATGKRGEDSTGDLNMRSQLICSLHVAFNTQSVTSGTYKAYLAITVTVCGMDTGPAQVSSCLANHNVFLKATSCHLLILSVHLLRR
jgi:hypothetical protein